MIVGVRSCEYSVHRSLLAGGESFALREQGFVAVDDGEEQSHVFQTTQ